jgi:hypothetical protein
MVYRFKATTEYPKNFLRIYEIKENQTLYHLHEHIQDDLGYAPDQMIVFRSIDEKGTEKNEYGLFDMGSGSIDSLSLAEMKKRGELTLLYVFDMHNDRFLKLEFIEEDEAAPRKVYPLTSEEKGLAPDQFSAKHIHGDDELLVSDPTPPSGPDNFDDDDDDDDDDDTEEEENEFYDGEKL